MRLPSTENRLLSSPSPATRSASSSQRFHESQQSPDGSAQPDPGVCSKAHQSLLAFPPSIWWAAVAVPHVNPCGKARPSSFPAIGTSSACVGLLSGKVSFPDNDVI